MRRTERRERGRERAVVAATIVAFVLLGARARAQSSPDALKCGATLLKPSPEKEANVTAGTVVELSADVDGDGVADRINGNGVGLAVTFGGVSPVTRAPTAYGNGLETIDLLLARDVDGTSGAEIVIREKGLLEVVGLDKSGQLRVIGGIAWPTTSASALALAGHFRGKSTTDILAGDGSGLSLFIVGGMTAGAVELMAAGLPALVPKVGASSTEVAVGDLDGDGLDDVLFPVDHGVAMARLGSRPAWEVFETLLLPDGRSRYTAAAIGDFDGDSRADVLVEPADVGGGTQVHTWLQKAAGQFTRIADTPAGSWTYANPLLVGDLSHDGADDFISMKATGRLVAGAWLLSPFPVSRVLSLGDWDGDGLLDYDALGSDLHRLQAHAARADLEVVADQIPWSADAGGTLSTTIRVINHGPTATTGLSLTTSLAESHFQVTGCSSPGSGCPELVLQPGQQVTVMLSAAAPAASGTVDVAVCSGAPDPVAANDAVRVPLQVVDVADLNATVTGQFSGSAFTIMAGAFNLGPSPAHEAALEVALPPESVVKTVQSDPPAACETKDSQVTCRLAAMDAKAAWSITLMGSFQYSGQSLTLSATASSATKDRFPDNNTSTLTVPPSTLGGLGAGAARAAAGCGCGLGGGGRISAADLLMAGLVVGTLLVRRRRREAARGRLLAPGPGAPPSSLGGFQ